MGMHRLWTRTEFVTNKCEDKQAHVSKHYTMKAYSGTELNVHFFSYTSKQHGRV